MQKRILVVGAGFAGMWSALAAMRLIDRNGGDAAGIEVVVVAPEPALVVRPRLYEAGAATMSAPLTELFQATGIRFIAGRVETIRAADHEVEFVDPSGDRSTLSYDRLILAAGSRLVRPNISGLQNAFSIDQLDEAIAFGAYLRDLTQFPDTPARNTVVVVGGGFTGIEIAAELPARLRSILGDQAKPRVIVVEQAAAIGPDLGPGPRPVITEALTSLGVEFRTGAAVTSIDASGIVTSNGERIEALTVLWTAGMRASDLTRQISDACDASGRLHVNRDLRVTSVGDVFATGDTAYAVTDDAGNHAMMSCQHAMILRRIAGNNAAADLLELQTIPYNQPHLVTCLDLGPWGAVVTLGWERTVQVKAAAAKVIKQQINGVLIYPPKADRGQALAAADPVAAADAIAAAVNMIGGE